jgi:ubiquinone/menaquinone biosynthesis C-methylase UbiE
MRLLDVGCGPGTITLDLAVRVSPAWRRWLQKDDGFFVVLHGELIARR